MIPLESSLIAEAHGMNTQHLTRGFFPYPAKVVRQIAGRLISLYADKKTRSSGLLADTFHSSGKVLVEAALRGIPSLAADINTVHFLGV
jgi:hypothetical protein